MNAALEQPADRPLDSVLEAQVAALLQRLEHHRDARCRAIVGEAEARARDIERQSWHEAAERVRAAARDARTELENGRQRLQASVDTQRRQRAQAEARRRLGELWRLLPSAMARRWRDAERRRIWVAAALELADRALSARAWLIEHAPDLDRNELQAALETAHLASSRSIHARATADIKAGLRILAEGARFDATTEGLLADVARIEAAFLAQCEVAGSSDACGILVEPYHG